MKNQLFILYYFLFLTLFLNVQTNTFPTTGNVGIGITSPDKPLVVKTQTGNTEMRILVNDNTSKS